MEDVFYNYFLERETEKRKNALVLFKKCEYRKLQNNYIHYLTGENKQKDLIDLSIDGAIRQLIDIKKKLPKNTANIQLGVRIEDNGAMFSPQEEIIYISWVVYNIQGEQKCSSLARHIANDKEWKMKHQPNGKDGKAALKLYKKLTF